MAGGREDPRLQDALAPLLSLDPETVNRERDPPIDRADLESYLERVEKRLDLFERYVNMRGGCRGNTG